MLYSKCARSCYRETRRIFFHKEARYKRQRRKTKEENENKEMRKRKWEWNLLGTKRRDCRICFCRQPGSDRFLIYFPWDHGERTNYMLGTEKRGDSPSRVISPSIRASFAYHCECIANDSHVILDASSDFSVVREPP